MWVVGLSHNSGFVYTTRQILFCYKLNLFKPDREKCHNPKQQSTKGRSKKVSSNVSLSI